MTFKIAVIGPQKSGKTVISNQLVGKPSAPNKYDATVGCRILPASKTLPVWNRDRTKRAQVALDVELWDCSGDHKYEGCWPAICENAHGVVICYNSNNREQANEVLSWCENFIKMANLTEQKIVIFAHGKSTGEAKTLRVTIGSKTFNVSVVSVQFQVQDPSITVVASSRLQGVNDDPYSAEAQFNNFLAGLYSSHPDYDESIFS